MLSKSSLKFGLVFAAAALGGTLACRPERDFRERQTGGAGQAGNAHVGGSSGAGGAAGGDAGAGAAGEAGRGGAPPLPCTEPTECSDGNACNGLEQCVGGLCVPGEPFCAAQEEDGCIVSCSESSGEPTCSKEVEDRDGDGHVALGNTCSVPTAKPRDDCDDSLASVYSGADEVCDGADNDCDGLDDFAAGMPLGGETRTLWTGSAAEAGGQPAIVWCDGIERYVAVWGTSRRVLAARMRVSGESVGSVQPLFDDQKSHTHRVLAACAGSTLGVLWTTVESNATSYRFARFGLGESDDGNVSQLDAVPLSLPLLSPSQPPWGVARAGSGGWAIFGADADSNGIVYRVGTGGAIVPPPHSLGGMNWENGIASSGDEVALFWVTSQGSGGVTFDWARFGGNNIDSTLPPTPVIGAIPMSSDGTAAISGLRDGFFLVGRTRSQRVLIAKRTYSGGDQDCGPIEIEQSPLPFSGDGEIRLATANDRSAFYMASIGGPSVFRLPVDCDQSRVAGGSRSALLTVEAVNGAATMALTSSPQGHIATWFSGASLRARAWGNAFCDTPQ